MFAKWTTDEKSNTPLPAFIVDHKATDGSKTVYQRHTGGSADMLFTRSGPFLVADCTQQLPQLREN